MNYSEIINKIKSRNIREYSIKNDFTNAIKEYIKFNNKVELMYSNRSNIFCNIFNIDNRLVLYIDEKNKIDINMLDIKEIVFTKRRLEILIK